MAERKAWEVYELGSKYFFETDGATFGQYTFGPYDSRGQAESSMAECDAMWE